jgi:uncharacterized protein YdhG (YjbR/CyaY superfamily)
MKPTNSIKPGGVEQYIAKHTKDIQEKLNKIRSAIQEIAPESTETVSYFNMPTRTPTFAPLRWAKRASASN